MTFADRYARANLKPTPETIAAREAPTVRVTKALTKAQLFSLVEFCFGCKPGDVGWLVEEYHKDDPSFSAYANHQECVVLASAILSNKVAEGDGTAILAIVATSFQGKRTPTGIEWLVNEAQEQLTHGAVSRRRNRTVETKIKYDSTPKLADEIAAIPVNEWAMLLTKLGSVRSEAQAAAVEIATSVSAALKALNDNANYMREESQILWWLFGEQSRTLNRPFASMSAAQLSIAAGIELGQLSTASVLGPVAAPAVIGRVINAARKDKGPPKASSLSAAVDSFQPEELARFKVHEDGPAGVFPIMAAIAKAKENGKGSWQTAFGKLTGLDPEAELPPGLLSLQLYQEHLLGQLK